MTAKTVSRILAIHQMIYPVLGFILSLNMDGSPPMERHNEYPRCYPIGNISCSNRLPIGPFLQRGKGRIQKVTHI